MHCTKQTQKQKCDNTIIPIDVVTSFSFGLRTVARNVLIEVWQPVLS